VNRLLERLGGGAVRWRWAVIIAWVIILGGLLGARHAFGGDFVNNYTVSGTDSPQDPPSGPAQRPAASLIRGRSRAGCPASTKMRA
jgi:hypothetical protein